MKVREVITYNHYFEEFFAAQNQNVRDKIIKILSIIETIERVPVQYLKFIVGTNWLFQKKTQKTPPGEIERSVKLMNEYYKEKEENKWKILNH